jgi:hypothetical protein
VRAGPWRLVEKRALSFDTLAVCRATVILTPSRH